MIMERNVCSGYKDYYRLSCVSALHAFPSGLYSFNKTVLDDIWDGNVLVRCLILFSHSLPEYYFQKCNNKRKYCLASDFLNLLKSGAY